MRSNGDEGDFLKDELIYLSGLVREIQRYIEENEEDYEPRIDYLQVYDSKKEFKDELFNRLEDIEVYLDESNVIDSES